MSQWVRVKDGTNHRHVSGLLTGGSVFQATGSEMEAFGDKFTVLTPDEIEQPDVEPVVELRLIEDVHMASLGEFDEPPASGPDLSVPYSAKMTAGARNLAAEYGLTDEDLSGIEPSGQDGQLLVSDVRQALKGKG